MEYLWIFLGCYGIAFIILNLKLSLQKAQMKSRIKQLGVSVEKFEENIRAELPLHEDILIRLWAPLVFSLIPFAVISAGYLLLS